MRFSRILAIVLTQVPLVLFLGAKFDLLFGFNRMDSGFGLLVLLFVSVPLLNLSWLVTETIRAVRLARQQSKTVTFAMPLIALVFVLESLAIDFYIAIHVRM